MSATRSTAPARSFVTARRLYTGAVATTALVCCSGCFAILPSDFLSSLVLGPDTTCEQLRQSLQLGPLRAASSPADLGLQFEALTVASANGNLLSGWFIPAQTSGVLDPEPLGTVLVTHGTDGTIPCTLPWAAVASSNRLHAVVFDYQGFGDSQGTANIATLLDDSDAVLRWIVADASPARQQVHLMGVSLGTSAALGLVSLRDRPQIRSVALDGAWDPEAMLGRVGPDVTFWLPLFDLSARLDFAWLFDMRAGLGNVTTPALFLAGDVDHTTPLAGAQTMYDLIGSPAKSMTVFPGRGHVQSLFSNEPAYVSLLVTFWRDPSAPPSVTASSTDPTIHVPSFAP
jgi:uncharacterized protein